MKPKKLIPLTVVVAILLALVVYKNNSKSEQTLSEQAGLVAMLPEGLSKSDLGKLELYSGASAEEKLVLAYDADADVWRVATHFDAPVKKDTIDKYLDALIKLSGEPRVADASEADLADFELTDDQAFHVVGYKKDTEDAAFHVLVGKGEYKSVFIRNEDDNDIYTEETDLRQQAGVYSSDEGAKPKPDTWLNKDVIKMEDTDAITKVALTYPDKSVVFEKREKPKAEEEKAADEGDAEGEDGETTVDVPDAEPEYEWVLASGGPGGDYKQSALDSLLRKFGNLTASDVVDPAKKAEWGLEPAGFRCTISVEGKDDVVIEGGRPSVDEDGYVRIAGAKDDLVYKLSKYTFEQIFPKGSSLFTLPGLTLAKDATESIELTQETGNVTLAKSGETWSVTSPAADLETQSTKLDTIVTTVTAWKPVDYADAQSGLGAATRTAAVLSGGEIHRLKVYGEAKSSAGVYARLDGTDTLLVMSKTDLDKIFVAPKDLYQRTLLDLDENDVAAIEGASPEGAFALVRGDEGWNLTLDGVAADADTLACDLLAEDIVDLQVAGIQFGQAALTGEPERVLHFTMKDGAQWTFSVGPEQDGQYALAVSGKAQTFVIGQSDVTNLFPAFDSLKKVEVPAEEPAEPATETTEATEPAAEAVSAAPVEGTETAQ
ncbi:MAG: DUF4340 domain-containing protein [Nitrospiraceae bacterium]|nr:DUF4340 domain-containing protein [Nitrospiraceae bacterium]